MTLRKLIPESYMLCFTTFVETDFFMQGIDKEKVSYAIGLNVAQGLQQQNIEELDYESFKNGVQDFLEKKDIKMSGEEAQKHINDFFTIVQKQKFSKNIEDAKKFHEEMAQKEGVTTLDSGLQYEVLKEGAGEKPTATSQVTTHYHGTLIDGTVFDSSVERNQPATFGVNQVIKGWTEALQMMNQGSKWRLYVPEHLAYGANPHPQSPIEPYSSLVFDVELLEVN